MLKRLAVVAALGMCFGAGATMLWPRDAEAHNGDGCCKHCKAGKACGDSCISQSAECHKPPGCACNE